MTHTKFMRSHSENATPPQRERKGSTRRNLIGCIKDALPFRQVVPIVKSAVLDGDPSITMLPSEFLIDENGIIVDLYRSIQNAEQDYMYAVGPRQLLSHECEETFLFAAIENEQAEIKRLRQEQQQIWQRQKEHEQSERILFLRKSTTCVLLV